MNNKDLQIKREQRKEQLKNCCQSGLHKIAKPKNNTVGTCQRCGKEKRIHATGLCSRCYAEENQKGFCKSCNQHAVLRNELCDPCYKKENYEGKCERCKRVAVLKNGFCNKCYKKQSFVGICRDCGSEDQLTKGLCHRCWDQEHRDGDCKTCGKTGSLRAGLCSTCYKNKNAQGECKFCGNTGVITDGLCRSCYDKEHYQGVCASCGNMAVLIRKYCKTCHNKEESMIPCKKCGNTAVVDHNGICAKCSRKDNNIAICQVCGKERPLVFGNMCRECYGEKASGVQHYMKSSIKKIIVRLLGKKNFKKDVDEIYLKGEKEPFKADFEIRSLSGKWCPAQYFNSREDWVAQHHNIEDFKNFYKKYLQPKNYIMFTQEHAHPDLLKTYLTDRGFLQPNGLPHGKKITKRDQALSKRDL